MGHALRVRIIFDRVSFLVYFLKYLLFPHNLESIFFLNRVSTLVEFAKNLWFITRWDNFSIVYHFWSIFLGSYGSITRRDQLDRVSCPFQLIECLFCSPSHNDIIF